MGQKAKGADAKVTEAVYVRLTEKEYVAICKAAEDSGFSVSRYMAQAAYQRASRVPEKVAPTLPARFARRGQTLRRLRAQYEPGRPEFESLNWAVGMHRYMTTDAIGKKMPGPPPEDIERWLDEVAKAHRERRRGPVLGAINWSQRMAAWVRALASSAHGPASDRPPSRPR